MNLLQKAASWVVRTLSLTNAVGWRDDNGTNPSGVNVTQDTALMLSGVWSCVNLIAGTTGTLPFMVYRNDAGGVRRAAPDHWLYGLLHDSPNADQTAVDFWEFIAASLEIRGNAYAQKLYGTLGRVRALVPVRPDIMATRRLPDGDIEYRWSDGLHSYTALSADVLHIRGFGGSPLGGLSTLSYGRNTFGLAQAIDTAAGSTFQNGLRPSGALVFKDFPKNGQDMANAEAKLGEKFAGAINAGKPMVLYGAEWQQFSINPEDAQMLESRGFSIEEICRFFGVPPIMIGHGEKTSSWGTGIQEVTLGFVKYTLRRRLKRIEQAVAKQLLTAADRAAGVTVEFNIEGLLRGDSTARGAFYQTALQNGWMTINEVRALENLPPVDGGDTPRMQMQNVPITSDPGIGHNGGPPLKEDA